MHDTEGSVPGPLIAALEEQERTLVLPRFDHDDAWRLGVSLVERARDERLPIAVDVQRGGQRLFHAALPGTTPDNASWIERKVAVVLRFGASSYLVGLRAQAEGTSFNEAHGLPFQQYSAVGGSFPIRVSGTGIVGTVTVSGLRPEDDHAVAVAALEGLLRR